MVFAVADSYQKCLTPQPSIMRATNTSASEYATSGAFFVKTPQYNYTEKIFFFQ